MEKNFNIALGIGSAKYVINYHDGVQTHRDGSPFYGIKIFGNKRKANSEINSLLRQGYTATNGIRF